MNSGGVAVIKKWQKGLKAWRFCFFVWQIVHRSQMKNNTGCVLHFTFSPGVLASLSGTKFSPQFSFKHPPEKKPSKILYVNNSQTFTI